MRRWYPTMGEEDLADVYADLPPGDRDRWVAVNMVASVDGSATLDGTSGGLGGGGDLAGFRALRAAVDVILVGAGTARTEAYGPPKVAEAARAARRARGQADRPAVAVVTRSLGLAGAERLLEQGRVVVITTRRAPEDARDRLARAGHEVITAGEEGVDLAAALDALADRGLRRVLAEGGPTLNHDLFAAGVVDELFVTVAPLLAGSGGPRIVAPYLDVPVPLALRGGRVHDGELLLRYAVEAPAPSS